MEAKDNNLKNIPKENPFSVPNGYFEGLTAHIMEQIPKEEQQTVEIKVTMWDKVRPILYLAAMFAGLGFFFKAIAFFDNSDRLPNQTDTLLVNSNVPSDVTMEKEYESEENEYLQYLEDQYTEALIQNELNAE